MANPIVTTSGKTAKAQIARLRAAREKPPTYDEVISALEALAMQSTVTLHTMRAHFNQLRLPTVAAQQVLSRLKRSKKLDIEV